jgi:hypothetical protein
MKRNIAAYTSTGINYPAYISVNYDEDDNSVEVTVRSDVKKDGNCGDVASIKLSAARARDIAKKLVGEPCLS